MYVRTHGLFLAVFFAFGALVASVTVPADASAPDACALVSKSQASAVLGTPITSLTPRSVGPTSNCTFKGIGVVKSIVVTTYGWSSISEALTTFKMITSSTAKAMPPAVPVAGIGDEAQQIGGNVYVRKGQNGYVFNVMNGAFGAARGAAATKLAKLVIH